MKAIQTKEEQEAFNKLTEREKYYVSLKVGESILSKMTEPEVKRLCAGVITRAMVDNSPNGLDYGENKNIKTKEESAKILQFQSIELYNELKGKFLSLTPSEVKEAFRLGIRGEYGPYFGLCSKTYHQFLKGFFDDLERGKAYQKYVDEYNGFKRAEKPVIPKSFYYNACEEAYRDYKENLKEPFTSAIYDFTAEYLGLKTLIEKNNWDEIKSRAEERYKKKLKEIPKDITREWTLDPKVNKVYASCIKSVALLYFYDKLITEGKEKLK